MRFLSRFVDSNDRELRRLQPWVDQINALEPEYEAMSDEDIRTAFADLRAEIHEAAEHDEPSDDELHHPDLERRRELSKAREERETVAAHLVREALSNGGRVVALPERRRQQDVPRAA